MKSLWGERQTFDFNFNFEPVHSPRLACFGFNCPPFTIQIPYNTAGRVGSLWSRCEASSAYLYAINLPSRSDTHLLDLDITLLISVQTHANKTNSDVVLSRQMWAYLYAINLPSRSDTHLLDLDITLWISVQTHANKTNSDVVLSRQIWAISLCH